MNHPNTPIDLTLLPAPQVIEPLDFEIIFGSMLADLQARDPTFSALLESDPAFKILQVCAYRELLLRERVNSAARAVMLAYATDTDLDQIAANYGVARLVVTPANPAATPPTDAVYEADDDFRARVLLSLESYTTAGSRGAYKYHALSVSGAIKDVGVSSLAPGTVNVAVLTHTGSGAASAPILAAVTLALSADTVRPLCDTVVVQSAEVVSYSVDATLDVYPGAGQAAIEAAALAALDAYTAAQHRMGLGASRSGIIAALHRSGVHRVTLTTPAADVDCTWAQAAWCTGRALTLQEIA
ncbi:MAG: baseplate J/gp47 family protein [Hydrogenophaga sp.]|uniref:baseplate assembly protein n=1 Tax=Hydrogenophaga sp. TaxID=1904254 RepID=UPI002717B01E|nr:baseplate J/gp47 family protein [Hydrogenophaga sp.]MDO9571174.1 baseplate J/gp47 family protein [Hydrogenophaga sp.]